VGASVNRPDRPRCYPATIQLFDYARMHFSARNEPVG
jgi:hypothetical protein